NGGVAVRVFGGVREGEPLQVRVTLRREVARPFRRALNVFQQLAHRWINRRADPGVVLAGRKCKQVNLSHLSLAGHEDVVLENSPLRQGIEHRPLTADLNRQSVLFVIDEKEGPVVAVKANGTEELLRETDRTTHPEAELIEYDSVSRGLTRLRVWRKVAIVKPVIRIQPGVAMVFVQAA